MIHEAWSDLGLHLNLEITLRGKYTKVNIKHGPAYTPGSGSFVPEL